MICFTMPRVSFPAFLFLKDLCYTNSVPRGKSGCDSVTTGFDAAFGAPLHKESGLRCESPLVHKKGSLEPF